MEIEDEDDDEEMEIEDEDDDEEEEEEEEEDEEEHEEDEEDEDEDVDEEDDEEVAKVFNIVSTCVTAIWVTVIAFRATRWVVEASVTSVVAEEPDIIWTVVASTPISSLNSDCRSDVMMVRRDTTVVSSVAYSVSVVTCLSVRVVLTLVME